MVNDQIRLLQFLSMFELLFAAGFGPLVYGTMLGLCI